MVTSNFRYESDFSKVTADLKNLVRQATETNTAFAQLNKTAASMKMEAARSFSAQAGFAGFRTQIVDLTGATQGFGEALMRNKLTMKQYFSEAAKAYKKDSQAYKLSMREVARANSTVAALGDIDGRQKGILITPETIDTKNLKTKMALASKQYEVFNHLVNRGATELVNWGKNTQWAGRQLTVGLTVPMGIFATKAMNAFKEVENEITRFRKVYGSDLTNSVEGATDKMLAQIQSIGQEFSFQFGIASKETIALAADLAAAGFEGQKLAAAVTQTTRLMVLGEVDRQEAMKATMSLQTAFKQSSKELAESVDFLNAVENQTSASLQDLTEAIPKTGPVIRALGGDIKDLSVLMTALREGGIASGEGANAIKSGMASLISPTKAASETARQFGIDLQGVVQRNRGDLMPMLLDFQEQLRGLDDFGKAQVIESIFGKYQFARISALFDNLNQRGSQTVKMIDLMNMSADELAKKSYSELKAQENSAATRMAAIQQQLTNQLIKVGAELAETLLPSLQSGLEFLSKIVDGFNNLPGPIKNFAKIIGGAVTVAGPLLMLAGMMGNLVGNTIKFGMSIVNMFKRITGNPVQQLEILSDQELAAKIAAEQLTGAYVKQKTSVDALNKSLQMYVANLRAASAVAPPGSYSPIRPRRFQTGGVVFASNGMTEGRINGYGGGDTVPALLEPGEFVINKQSSQKYAPLLRDINQGRNIPGYQNAGMVGENGAVSGTERRPYTPRADGNLDSLKGAAGGSPKNYLQAIKLLDPEDADFFKKALVTEQNFKETIKRFQGFKIPGFGTIDIEDYKYGTRTDRAHFASLQNLVLFTDAADNIQKYSNVKDFMFTTASDNAGVNQLLQNLSPSDIGSIASSLGYDEFKLKGIIGDTRPIIVNPELRELFSKIENELQFGSEESKRKLSSALFSDYKGQFSSNKTAKTLGAISAANISAKYADDPVAVRKILESQIKHSIAQSSSKAEWERVKLLAGTQIDELVDILASGKMSETKLSRIKEINSQFTNRRLLTDREVLIIKEFRDISTELDKMSAADKDILKSIPDYEKNALIDELGIRNRVGVTATSLASPKNKPVTYSRNAELLSLSGEGVPFTRNLGLLNEQQILDRQNTPKNVPKIKARGRFVPGRGFVPFNNGGMVQQFALGGQVLRQIMSKKEREASIVALEKIQKGFSLDKMESMVGPDALAGLRKRALPSAHDKTLYRGHNINIDDFERIMVGETISVPGSQSYSADPFVAERFANMNMPGGDYRRISRTFQKVNPKTGMKQTNFEIGEGFEQEAAVIRQIRIDALEDFRQGLGKLKNPVEREAALARYKELDEIIKADRFSYSPEIRAAKEELEAISDSRILLNPEGQIKNAREQLAYTRAYRAKHLNKKPVIYKLNTPKGTMELPVSDLVGGGRYIEDVGYLDEMESILTNAQIKVRNKYTDSQGRGVIEGDIIEAARFALGGMVGKMKMPKNPNAVDDFVYGGNMVGEATGKSTKGASGFYNLKGKQQYVKFMGDDISTAAEVAANRILAKMFPNITVPRSRIGKVDGQLAAISDILPSQMIDDVVAQGGSASSSIEAMLAQSIAGGRDLSPGNFMLDPKTKNILHVDPSEAFAKKLASGKPAMSSDELVNAVDRAMANFGMIKGGAKKFAREQVKGFGLGADEAKGVLDASLGRAMGVSREDLIMEVQSGLRGMPKRSRRALDAWARQVSGRKSATFEDAMIDIAQSRLRDVSGVTDQLALGVANPQKFAFGGQVMPTYKNLSKFRAKNEPGYKNINKKLPTEISSDLKAFMSGQGDEALFQKLSNSKISWLLDDMQNTRRQIARYENDSTKRGVRKLEEAQAREAFLHELMYKAQNPENLKAMFNRLEFDDLDMVSFARTPREFEITPERYKKKSDYLTSLGIEAEMQRAFKDNLVPLPTRESNFRADREELQRAYIEKNFNDMSPLEKLKAAFNPSSFNQNAQRFFYGGQVMPTYKNLAKFRSKNEPGYKKINSMRAAQELSSDLKAFMSGSGDDALFQKLSNSKISWLIDDMQTTRRQIARYQNDSTKRGVRKLEEFEAREAFLHDLMYKAQNPENLKAMFNRLEFDDLNMVTIARTPREFEITPERYKEKSDYLTSLSIEAEMQRAFKDNLVPLPLRESNMRAELQESRVAENEIRFRNMSPLEKIKAAFNPRENFVQNRQTGGVIFGHGMDSGGRLNGYGGGDTVPAMLEPGEFVINKKSSAKHAPLLRAINKNELPGFNNGNTPPTKLQRFNQSMGGGSGMMMNTMFLPMTIGMIGQMEGVMKQMTIAVTALQGLVVAIQAAALIQTAANKVSAAGGLAGMVTSKGKSMQDAGALGGVKNLIGGALIKLAPMAGPLALGALAVAGVAAGIMWWKSRVQDLAKDSRSMYTQATEMAKVYNIEIMNTAKALEENTKYAKAYSGIISDSTTGKGLVDKDYANAVTKDFENLITAIKNTGSEQQKTNMIAAQYASLIAQGYSTEQAQEITAEIARQASATSNFASVSEKLKNSVTDAASAMQVIDSQLEYQISTLGTATERLSAFNAAWQQLATASASAPTQMLASSQSIMEAMQNESPDDLKTGVNDLLIQAGYDDKSRNKIFDNILPDGDWSSETGLRVATAISNALAMGIDISGLEKGTLSLDKLIEVEGVTAVAQQMKLELNKDLDEIVSQLEENLDAVNNYYDDAVSAVEKEIRAIQKGAEEKQKALEDEANALNDRKDALDESTNFYIDQLQKEYEAEQFYQKQRETALGGLQSLSQGDVFGYLQAQQKMASDASQFGREQAISQIEDTSDAAQKALDGRLDSNAKARDQLNEETQNAIENRQEEIALLQSSRSKIVKSIKDQIESTKALKDTVDIADGDVTKLENNLNTYINKLPDDLQVPFTNIGENLTQEFAESGALATAEVSTATGISANKLAGLVEDSFASVITTAGGTILYKYNGKDFEIEVSKKTKQKPKEEDDAGDGIIEDSGGGELKSLPVIPAGSAPRGFSEGSVVTVNGKKYRLVDNNASPFITNYSWERLNRGGMVKYAKGGFVPGVGMSDKVPAMLTPGEFVVDKSAASRNRSLLSAMNSNVAFNTPDANSYGKLNPVEINKNVDMGGVNININGTSLSAEQLQKSVIKALEKATNSLETSRRY
jgi:TP901 family phage tail tape measure protein